MASLTQIVARVCEDILAPMREAGAEIQSLRQCGLDAAAARHCEGAARAGAKVLELLEIAAELQKAEMGELTLDPRPRRLRELMDEVESRWMAAAEMAGVRLMVSYDGDPESAAVVDWSRLALAIDALLARALASPGAAVVEASLATRLSENGIVVSCKVRDDAAQTPATSIETLLETPVRGERAEGIGVALRLALAGHVIAAMGGELATRANVGQGATSTFELTLSAPRPSHANPDAHAPAGRTAHILIVDDNATNRMVVEALCEMFECSTESVADGVEAVEAARVGRFDVILMDIKMPRMDGLTATREIRKLPGAAGRPPIVALTANAAAEDARAYLAAGMCAVVEKPIKAERLLAALEEALAEPPVADAKTAAA